MERMYFVTAGESVTVYYRPTYNYITSCDMKDAKKVIKSLLDMTTEQFYDYLQTMKVRIPSDTSSYTRVVDDTKDKEQWYQNAWRHTTKVVLDKYKLRMVDEEVPYEYLKEKAERERVSKWNIGKQARKVPKKVEKAKDEIVATKETKETKKPAKKVPKKVNRDLLEDVSIDNLITAITELKRKKVPKKNKK